MVFYVNIKRFDQVIKKDVLNKEIFLAAKKILNTHKISFQMLILVKFLFLMDSSDDDRMGDVASSRGLRHAGRHVSRHVTHPGAVTRA